MGGTYVVDGPDTKPIVDKLFDGLHPRPEHFQLIQADFGSNVLKGEKVTISGLSSAAG